MSWDRAFDELTIGAAGESYGRTLTDADIAAFAALTGDMNPLHIDAEWAARSPFGQRVAHGMLLLSYAIGLSPFVPDRVFALRGLREAVFKRPVAIGDTIRVRAEVTTLHALDDELGLVGCSLRIVNQRAELCVRAQIELLWRRAPAAGAGS